MLSILIDNKAIGDVADSKDRINVLSCKEITMVHDGIYLIKTHDNQTFLKESKDTWMTKPVVEFNVLAHDKLSKNVRFVLEENSNTRMNFSALGIKHQPKPKQVIVESANDTIQNVYEQRLKRIADESVVASKQRIQELVESQKSIIAEMVQNQTAEETQNIVENIIDELIQARDAIVEDLSTQRHALLAESSVRMVELENDLDTFKDQVSNEITSRYTKLKEAIDATASVQNEINRNKSAFEQEFKNIKIKLARVAESGGGTNAVQYANGGFMNGNLTVHGDISASGNLTGHIALSSLNQEGAVDGDVITWSSASNSWIPSFAAAGKHVAYLGDGIDSVFVVTHALSSVDLLFQVYDTNTQEVVYPYIRNIDDQNTFVAFSNTPTASAYKIVIKK